MLTASAMTAALLLGGALARAPTVSTLAGAPQELGPGPVIALFWRADCAPCLLELADLEGLRRAAPPLEVVPVGLQAADRLEPALTRMGLKASDSLRTDEDAATLLSALGGAPPRLPLSVAFSAGGRPCARRTGYLGRDQVRAWARACGGPHAGR